MFYVCFGHACVYMFSVVYAFIYIQAYIKNMNAHVILKLLNELRKSDKMRGLPSILSLFRNEFNLFNTTGVQMLDTVYQMTLKLH